MTTPLLNKIKNLVRKNNIKKSDLLIKRYLKDNPFEQNIQKFYLDVLFSEKKFSEVTKKFLYFFKDTKDLDILKLCAISLSELQRYKEAEAYFKNLVDNAKTAENYCLLAMSQHQNNKIDESIDSFEKAIALDNNNEKIYINYANFLRNIDQNINAIKILENYNSRINNINVLTLLIGINRDIQNHQKALDYCLQAIDTDPENSYFHLILATLELELGRKEKALENLNKSLVIRPFLGPSHRLLSLLKNDISAHEFSEIEDYIKNNNIEDANVIQLGLAASNYLENNKEFNKSFIYLEKFNSCYRKLLDYNFEIYVEKFFKIKKIYNSIKNKKLNLSENATNYSPIFILGLPRSGTSLVEQILSSDKKISPCGELIYLDKKMQECMQKMNEKLNNINVLEEVPDIYIKAIKNNLNIESSLITDKMPLNFFYMGIIKKIFPNSKIILCKRNKMDNIYSLFRNFFPSGNNFSYDIKEIKNFYELYENIIEYWNENKIDFLEVSYEELVIKFEYEASKMMRYVNLDFDEKSREFYKNNRVVQTASFLQVRKPIFNSSINFWKNYKKQLT